MLQEHLETLEIPQRLEALSPAEVHQNYVKYHERGGAFDESTYWQINAAAEAISRQLEQKLPPEERRRIKSVLQFKIGDTQDPTDKTIIYYKVLEDRQKKQPRDIDLSGTIREAFLLSGEPLEPKPPVDVRLLAHFREDLAKRVEGSKQPKGIQ